MARNKAYDIVAFEGGLNNHADARDIEDNQLAELVNLLVTNKGVISTGYETTAYDVNALPVISPTSETAVINTKNLWTYHTDFLYNNTDGAQEYLLYSDGQKLYRIENNAWVEIIDLSVISLHPSLVTYDGHIRFSDGSLSRSGDSPYLPSSATKLFGVVRRKYFTEVQNTTSEVTGNASIIKPTDGKIVFNKEIESNNPTRGYLGLEANKINHIALDSVSFGTASAPSNPTMPGTYTASGITWGYPSVYDTMAINDEVSAFGESIVEIDNGTTANSVFRDVQANKTYSSSDISSGTQVGFNASGWLSIGDNGAGDSSECTFFITLDDNANSYDFGTIRRSLRINGDFQELNSATNYSSLNVEPDIYPIAEDGAVGSVLTVLSGNDANGNENKDDAHTNYANYRFEDTSEALKYKVVLKASGNEQIRLTSLQIFQSLAPITSDSTLAKFARLTARVPAQSDGHYFQFDDIFSTSVQTHKSSMFVRIAIPNGNIRQSNANAVNPSEWPPTKIVLKFATSSSYDNYRLYSLGPEWISKNRGSGWIDIPIDLEQIADITGTANIGDIDCLRVEVYKDGYSNYSVHDLFIDIVSQIEEKKGTWDGYYKFYYSWVYDRIQESPFYEFFNQSDGIQLSSNQLETKSLIRELNAGGFGARARRITGANVYFAEYDEQNNLPKYDDPFLLMSCDFERGVKKPNSQSLEVWSAGLTATDHFTHSKLTFIDPPLSTTFSINSGYEYDPLTHIEELRFRDAETLNRKVYYGNVDIVWERFRGETSSKYNRYGDRVYKSLPNKPDIVPSYNYLDIDINDGDEITALASYADRLLVFKNNMMYIVNATEQMEYLEDKHRHKGVVSNRGVVDTDIGVAWVNSNGAYHYDGEKVIDLSKGKIKQASFASQVGGNPSILYEPKERHLMIFSKDSVNGLIFDLDTEAWSYSTKGILGANKPTNLNLYLNKPIIGAVDSNCVFHQFLVPNAGEKVYSLKTKDFALNEIGGKADIKSIYITYKGTMSDGTSNGKTTVKYYPNKSSNAVALTGGDLATTGSYITAKLTPNPKTGGRSVHSIQIAIDSTGASGVGYNDFELHDISIVYKEKSLK